MQSPIDKRPTSTFWMILARVVAYAFILFCLSIFTGGVLLYPSFASAHPELFLTWNWTQAEMDYIFSRVGLSFQWWIQWNLVSTVLFAATLYSIAFLILLKNRNDWFSLYVATSFVFFATQSNFPPEAISDALPSLNPILSPLTVFAWVSILLIFYAFPDGRFVPSWMVWIAGSLVVLFAIDILYYQGKTPPPLILVLIFLLLGLGVASQIYRYRWVSNPLQRQQTKWVIFSMLVAFMALISLVLPFIGGGRPDPTSPLALFLAFMASSATIILGFIPLSIALAILRYRLWDIDVIIRRTLIYGTLTASLALLYAGSVVILQQVFQALTGSTNQSPLAIVVSTLAVAALFNPLRRRLQERIDRRFFRQKYDAERILAEFAETSRQQTDLDTLTGQLVEAVNTSLQPESISVWVKGMGKEKAQ